MIPRRLAAFALALAACRGGSREHAGEHDMGAPAGSAPLTAGTMAGHEAHREGAAAPPGYAPVTIDQSQIPALGLRTAEVATRDFSRAVRTVGVVALDETRTAHVHAKVRGWIDALAVDFVGKDVSRGQVLCSIYSQDVYAAELEFLSVLDRVRGRPAASGEFAVAERRAQEQLLEAARRRLALWDVPKAEIDRLESTREAKRTFPLLSPRSGTVVAKQALAGMFVDPAVELYTVADMSRVWVLADVYEADVPFVHVGDAARLSIEGVEASIDAKIAFLPPTVDEATRTLKARFELPNGGRGLRPGAFVDVTMDLATARALAVPESAVIRTGKRAVVFVAHGDPPAHLEPREIAVGPVAGGFCPVAGGLSAGERVATGAQFLLDSESRLRGTTEGPGGGHVH